MLYYSHYFVVCCVFSAVPTEPLLLLLKQLNVEIIFWLVRFGREKIKNQKIKRYIFLCVYDGIYEFQTETTSEKK